MASFVVVVVGLGLFLWGEGGGGVGMFFKKKKKIDGKSVMSTFCNVIMLSLLYVHVCVTRTGWKTRTWPKTVILSIKKSNQSNQNKCIGEAKHTRKYIYTCLHLPTSHKHSLIHAFNMRTLLENDFFSIKTQSHTHTHTYSCRQTHHHQNHHYHHLQN